MGAELRRFARHPLKVDFKGQDRHGMGALFFTGADLSQGGSFIRAELLLEQGEELELEFTVPGVPRLMHARARIAWVRRFPEPPQQGGMGIEFLTMTEEDRLILAEYLGAA